LLDHVILHRMTEVIALTRDGNVFVDDIVVVEEDPSIITTAAVDDNRNNLATVVDLIKGGTARWGWHPWSSES
jgi:hypothetical protein